jgi:putative transcriptional regulator
MDMLLRQVENTLEKSGFGYCVSDGCFDIAARRNFTMFLKVLGNVDSFQEAQATNLKVLSRGFGATVALVGLHTRRESLRDNIVYDRFDIPTLTPTTLESMLVNDLMPLIYRSRGGLFSEINPDKLRNAREKAELTQQELAKRVGVTKKNIYEHEHEKKKALLRVVKKIENLVGNVSDPININTNYEAVNKPADVFERLVSYDLRKMGFSTDIIYQTSFNILAKEGNTMILSKADDNRRRLEKNADHISDLADLMNMHALAITKDDMELEIPTVMERDLRTLGAKDLRRLLN